MFRTLLLVLLVLGACGGESMSTTSTSTSDGNCSEWWGDGPDIVPEYPACGCNPDRCGEGAACRAEGPTPYFTASACLPACTDLLTCPMLGNIKPECANGWCVPRCLTGVECPAGYVCSEAQVCLVKLE